MKLRLLIIPALMATALFAQGPGPGGRRQAGTAPTPPSPAQAAGRELNMIAAALRLTPAQSSALTGDTAVVTALTTEQTTLQGNAATLRADWTTANAAIAGGSIPDFTAIEGLNQANLTARATAAVAVLKALPGLGITLTTNQQAGLIRMMVDGGGPRGPGGFGGGRRF